MTQQNNIIVHFLLVLSLMDLFVYLFIVFILQIPDINNFFYAIRNLFFSKCVEKFQVWLRIDISLGLNKYGMLYTLETFYVLK